jgi:ABC-2 type transport system ATP-binding protein
MKVNFADTPVLELVDLKKSIRGKEIIKGLNLTLKPSEVFGFLGPNGAGKTTTIRMIVGLIKPTYGSVRICGYSVTKDFVKAMSNIGSIIESPEMYKYLTGMDNLKQFAAMDNRVTDKRIHEVVDMVGLKNRVGDKVSTYSLGMRQRLGIAQAILSKPKLLILDEPTNGLDPAGITEFRRLIRNLAEEEGMTVFVSSHLLSEIQLMCDRFSIIKQGEIIKTAPVKDILTNEAVTWQVDDPNKAAQLLKENWGYNSSIIEDNTILAHINEALLPEINKSFINSGISLKFSFAQKKSLEELFLDLTEGDEIV